MKQLYSLLVLLSVTAVATAEIKVESVMVSMRDGVARVKRFPMPGLKGISI